MSSTDKFIQVAPYKLVETWFWMAYKSKDGYLNNQGLKRISNSFGCKDNAIKIYPELRRFSDCFR